MTGVTGNPTKTAPPVTPHRAVPSRPSQHSHPSGRRNPSRPVGPTFVPLPSGPPPGPRSRTAPAASPWNSTPNGLRFLAAVILLAAVAAGIATASYAATARGRVTSVVRTDAPSVQATADFLLKVADMDAQLTNVLLVHDDTTLSIRRADSMRLYEADRSAADADLTRATAVLAGDAAAERTLRSVTDLFGDYQERAVRTMQLDELARLTTAGNAPVDVLGDYRDTLVVLEGPNGTGATPEAAPSDQQSLLYQARLLDRQSADAISRSASATQGTLTTAEVVTALAALVLLALLGTLQAVLAASFRRILNPFLALATLVAVAMLAGGLATFFTAGDRLHDATDNAFGSIRALTDAKALASDANADESRWLLDRGNADRYEQAFLTKAQDIVRVGAGDTTLGTYEPALQGWLQSYSPDTPATGLAPDSAFGTEFGNITYPGEAGAALNAVTAFDAYLNGDAQIRASFDLTRPDGLRKAIDFDTDVHNAASSDAMFNAFNTAMDQVIAVNQQAFDASSASALDDLGPMTWLPWAEALAVAALTALGLRARLREFR